MFSRSRDTYLTAAIFLALIVALVYEARQQAAVPETLPYLASSTSPEGTAALYRWLDELGYPTSNEALDLFSLPPTAEIIFLLNPSQRITDGEWETLNNWVNEGGTLVVAGTQSSASAVFGRLDFRPIALEEGDQPVWLAAPFAPAPDQPAPLTANRAWVGLESTRTDFVPLYTTAEAPIAVWLPQGQGQWLLSTAVYPFTNAGLAEGDNGRFVLTLFNLVQKGQPIWFDEWHHGQRNTAEIPLTGPGDWLRQTNMGQALLYVGLLLFVGLGLSGRRFGRAIPLPRDNRRRAPIEYITAIANLNRRTGQRQATQAHYHARLKRTLGKTYRVNPTLPDEAYVAELGRYHPALDSTALLTLLQRLKNQYPTETELLQIAQEVDEWMKG